MTALNYEHEVVYYNSMFAWPTPQSRDRMYGVFWKKGNRKPNLDFYPPAPCSVCQKNVGGIQTWKKRKRWGKYGTLESKQGQYFYRCPYCHNEVIPYFFAAFNAIDWSIQAERIGDRKRPLKPKTLERIKYGLERYGRKPLIISPRYNQGIGSRVHDASIEAFPTQLTEATHAVAMPWFIRTSHTQGNGMYTHGPVNPGFTQTTRQDIGIVGFLSKQYGGKADPKHVNLGLDDVLGTVTTWDHHAFISLAPGFLVRQNDSGSNPEKRSISLDRPLATVLSDDTHAFVEIPPSFIAELHGTSKAAGVDEPLMCITGGGGHHAILNTDAFLAYYYGTQNASGIADPLNTLTATDRAGLVEILDSIKVEDLTFRMLQPHEIGTAMAFPDSYTVLGTKRDKVKQYGNAVTPPVMEMILERAIETL
jgi:DNA (cytosine-5)-methyltransferase 1